MKGYRTIAYNVIALVAGLLGLHLSMDNVNMWLDLGAALFPAGNIVLRMFTTTPFGQQVVELTHIFKMDSDDISLLAGAVAAALPPPPVAILSSTADPSPVPLPAIDLSAVVTALGAAMDAVAQAHAAVSAATTVSNPAPQPALAAAQTGEVANVAA